MTITDIVHTTLARYYELSTTDVFRRCAGQPGISKPKSVRNALAESEPLDTT